MDGSVNDRYVVKIKGLIYIQKLLSYRASD